MDPGALLVPVLTVGGVGLAFGGLIAVANRRFHVHEDPRIDEVNELLPGTNCGACGFPGCRPFAEGLIDGATQPAACTNMGPEDIDTVADYLGVDAGEVQKRVARLLCAGGSHVADQRASYLGLETCAAAAVVASGGKACSWGCLGLADCEVSCDFDAIAMNDHGLPVVDPEKCTACNDCVEACPKDLFVLMPIEYKLLVQCKSALEGDEAEALCRVACTACGRCAQDAAADLIKMEGGLAVVDYARNDDAGPEAIARCPTDAIVWLEGTQFQESATS